MPDPTALVIGGTGPSSPHIVRGLEERGYSVTIMHTGAHELDEVMHLEHLHCDVKSGAAVAEAIGDREFDVVVASYGRLREIAEVFVDRCGQFISIGGVPVYKGFFNADAWTPAGLPVPTAEDAPKATEDQDGKSYRIARTEEIVFELQPRATHFRYPYIYGARQFVPREWCIVRRILDGRRQIIVPDDGLTVQHYGYNENVAHAVLMAVDHPEAAAGHAFHAADEQAPTLRQVIEIVAASLDAELEIVSMPWDIAVPARPMIGRHRTTHVVWDLTKLKTLLGYRDKVPMPDALARTAKWLVDNPPEPGGMEETVLQDPFDYPAEDRLIAAWRGALASMPEHEFDPMPGLGLHYAGPGTTYVRPDTRI